MSRFEGVGPDSRTSVNSRRLRSNRRTFIKSTTGVAAGISIAGCLDSYAIAGGTQSDDPVTIGVLAPNPKSDFIGRSMVRSAEVAVEELNENGGIDDRVVELVTADTNGSPTEARRQYQRLILEAEADVTVGVFDSVALMNIMDDIAEQETIHLTTGAATSAASRLVSQDYDRYKYHFRAGPTNDRDLPRGMIAFLETKAPDLGWESVAVIAEGYEWTRTPWDYVQQHLGGVGLDIAMQRRYPPAIDDFSDLYDEIEQAGADATLIMTAHTGTDALLDWVIPRPRMFAFGGMHVPVQLPTYYDQTNGACRFAFSQVSATAQSEVGALTQNFVRRYQDTFDGSSPVYTGYHTYDAIMLFADAVDVEGTLDADSLVPALEATSFDGSTGTIEFYDPDHQFAHDLAYNEEDLLFFQWQENDDGEGVQEVFWPEQHATSEFVTPPWLE